MSDPRKVRAVPEGYGSVTPYLIVKGVAPFLDFLKEAFGAAERGRVHNDDGTIGHAEVRIGDSVVMMFDAKEGWPETPSFLTLYVEDCDEVLWDRPHLHHRQPTPPRRSAKRGLPPGSR
jgi:hypothetical protein